MRDKPDWGAHRVHAGTQRRKQVRRHKGARRWWNRMLRAMSQ